MGQICSHADVSIPPTPRGGSTGSRPNGSGHHVTHQHPKRSNSYRKLDGTGVSGMKTTTDTPHSTDDDDEGATHLTSSSTNGRSRGGTTNNTMLNSSTGMKGEGVVENNNNTNANSTTTASDVQPRRDSSGGIGSRDLFVPPSMVDTNPTPSFGGDVDPPSPIHKLEKYQTKNSNDAVVRMEGSASWMSNSNYDEDGGGMSIGSAIIGGGIGGPGKRRRRPLATGYIPGSSVGGRSASISGAAASATRGGMYSSVVNRVSPSELLKMSSKEAEERAPQTKTRRQKRQQQTLIAPSHFHHHHQYSPTSSPHQRPSHVPPSPGGSYRNNSGPLHERDHDHVSGDTSFNQAHNAVEDSPATKLLFGPPSSSVPPMAFGEDPVVTNGSSPISHNSHSQAQAPGYLTAQGLSNNHNHHTVSATTTSTTVTSTTKPLDDGDGDGDDITTDSSSTHPQSPLHLKSGPVVAQISSSSFTPRGREVTNIYNNGSIGNASDSATFDGEKTTPVIVHAGPPVAAGNGSGIDLPRAPPTPGAVTNAPPGQQHHHHHHHQYHHHHHNHRSNVNFSIVDVDSCPTSKRGVGATGASCTGMGVVAGLSSTTDKLYQSIQTLNSGEYSSDGSDIGDDELLLNGSFVNTDMRVLAGLNEALADRERAMAMAAESSGNGGANIPEDGPIDGAPVVTDKKMRSRARSRARSIRHALAASGLTVPDRSFNSNSNNSPAATSSFNIATALSPDNNNNNDDGNTTTAAPTMNADDAAAAVRQSSDSLRGAGMMSPICTGAIDVTSMSSIGGGVGSGGLRIPTVGSDDGHVHPSTLAQRSQRNSTSTQDVFNDYVPLGLIPNHDTAHKSGSHYHLSAGSSSSAPTTPSKTAM